MPSGVSQGSALPAGIAAATGSKETSAKFGMRLMGYHYSTCDIWGAPPSIMIRMLVADDAICLFRPVILQRGLARHVGDGDHPAEPGFGSKLPCRHHLVGVVERTGHDLDSWPADAAKAQRRAAGGAKIAFGDG